MTVSETDSTKKNTEDHKLQPINKVLNRATSIKYINHAKRCLDEAYNCTIPNDTSYDIVEYDRLIAAKDYIAMAIESIDTTRQIGDTVIPEDVKRGYDPTCGIPKIIHHAEMRERGWK